jgi:hypothetical protein
VALGTFGALVTAGLFLYELRQIDVCKQLRDHAAWIERQLGIESGQFGGRRKRLTLRQVYSPGAIRKRDECLILMERSGEARDTDTCRHRTAEEVSTKTRGQPKPGSLDRLFIGAGAAGYVIYHVVLVAWIVTAGVGIANLI